jgi:hypothetical protein
MLRIYDLDGEVGGSVPVYVFDNHSSTLFGWKTFTFAAGPYLDYPKVPGFTAIDLATVATPPAGHTGRVRVQVGQKHLPKRLWCMISVDTQQVTIITPQK